MWEGLAPHSPADEALGGRGDGFSRRDLFLVFTAGEDARDRAMVPLDAEPEPGDGAAGGGLGAAPGRYAGEAVTSGPPAGDPAPDVIDLGDRRRAHRQARRVASLQVVVVLPHTEGELAEVLNHLEDRLLHDVDADEPVVDADPEAADAVGRLASLVSRADRGEPAVQPIAPISSSAPSSAPSAAGASGHGHSGLR